MASSYVSPGFYIREIDESLFVSSLADTPLGLVGAATWGPTDEATLITSTSQLFTIFGPLSGVPMANYSVTTPQYPTHPMLYAAERYLRRGRRMYIVRVASNTAAFATGKFTGDPTNVVPPSINSTAPVVTPPAVSLTETAGTSGYLAGGTYSVIYTWVTVTGETTASPTQSSPPTITGPTGSISVTIPSFPTNVVKANIYIGTTAGTEKLIKSVSVAGATVLASLAVDNAPTPYAISARYKGTMGNNIRISVSAGSNSTNLRPTRKITVFLKSTVSSKMSQVEIFDGVTADPTDVDTLLADGNDAVARISAEKSKYITLSRIGVPTVDTAGIGVPTAPGSPTAGTDGALRAGSYSLYYTYVKADGTESLPTAAAVSVTVVANGSISFTASSIPGTAVALNIYLGAVGFEYLAQKVPVSGASATVVVNREAGFTLPAISAAGVYYTPTGGVDGTPLSTSAAEYKGISATATDPPTGLQIFRNTEAITVNLLAVPGIFHVGVVNEVIDIAQSRQDCLGIVDPPPALTPQGVTNWHNGVSGMTNAPAVALNSSFATLFWPWCEISDAFNGQNIFIPPSGIAAEIMANTDAVSEPHFAPAGLNRGKVFNIIRAQYLPTQGDRDTMYSAGNAVNPITTFAGQGVVVWGQRTLQREPTALDRINVRRLVIILRTSITRAARSLVFEPNDPTMWRSFVNLVTPVCQAARNRRGLVDFRVIMDSTTNTPDVIEQNQAVGKVIIKPTKSAEIIVVDMVLVNQAAQFTESIATDIAA